MTRAAFFLVCFFFLFFGVSAEAAQIGTALNFTVDSSFDLSGRNDLNATLVFEGAKAYFYIDKIWWDSLSSFRQSQIVSSLNALDQEFENKIYPNLTSAYGSEWNPGIDGNPKITILFEQMKEGAAGYFREADEHLKLQVPDSNEREMVYLALAYVESPLEKSFLAHEFTHVITYNQKQVLRNVTEDTWLNEARADYAPTLLGYDAIFSGSLLETRVQAFLQNPTTSLVEWQGRKQDYGIVSLFIHYLVDHYGAGILTDSMRFNSVGIASLNEALKKNGFDVDFSQVFTNWAIAVFLNDCQYGKLYCYLNQNLAVIKLTANTNFLPLTGKSVLQVSHVTKNWTGNWFRFVGGQGALEFSFEGLKGLRYAVPYLVQDKDGTYTLNFLKLDSSQKGAFSVSHFGIDNKAAIVIPILETTTTAFDDVEPTYPFSFTVSILDRTPEEEQALIAQLLAQIDSLKKEIAKVQAQLFATQTFHPPAACGVFTQDLGFGSQDHNAVYCLQELLSAQGSDVYPEGLVTGNFGPLTLQAVNRFQEKYGSEILAPLRLAKGTGFVGEKTREKLNQFVK